MVKLGTIYKATAPDGRCYVGFDSRWPRRKTAHLQKAFIENEGNYNTHFHRAIRKYGRENFTWEILYQSNDLEHTLNKMEPHFIQEYNSFGNGFNMTKGGEGRLGSVMTEEHKRMLIDMHKNASFEMRKRWSDAAKARGIHPNLTIRSAETKRGKKLSREHVNKMLEKRIKLWLVTYPDGTMKQIRNMKMFCKNNGLSAAAMTNVNKGRKRHHHGFKCRKIG